VADDDHAQTALLQAQDEVEDLQIVAMVLAEMIASGELLSLAQPGAEPAIKPRLHLTGAALAEGIALGHVVLHEPRVVVTNVIADDPQKERTRLMAALETLQSDLDTMLERGDVEEIEVEGSPVRWLVLARDLPALTRARRAPANAQGTTLLSPFDSLLWYRGRVARLFGFDYRIECYTPEAKRRYGYFVLPILRRGALVGRLDAKAHRREGVFQVKALYLEPGVRPSAALAKDIAAAISESPSVLPLVFFSAS